MQDKQTRARGLLSPSSQAGACSVQDGGWTRGIHIAVLKEFVTTAGKDNGTKLAFLYSRGRLVLLWVF